MNLPSKRWKYVGSYVIILIKGNSGSGLCTPEGKKGRLYHQIFIYARKGEQEYSGTILILNALST